MEAFAWTACPRQQLAQRPRYCSQAIMRRRAGNRDGRRLMLAFRSFFSEESSCPWGDLMHLDASFALEQSSASLIPANWGLSVASPHPC